MTQLEMLVLRLDEIAEKNGDQFRYVLTPEILRAKFRVSFWAYSRTSKKEFVGSHAPTIDAAIQAAWLAIPEACYAWGYQQP